MPDQIWLDPWHRLSRALPTYEAVAHQAVGPDWTDFTRTVQVAPAKGRAYWVATLSDQDRILRSWPLPDARDAVQAQKAAHRLVVTWGISDEDISTEAGVMASATSLERPGGFAWAKLKKTVVAMFQNAQTRADGVTVINRLYPRRGYELDEAMKLVERAAQNDFMALLDIKAVTDAVKSGSEILRPELEKLRMVNEARKESALTPAQAFQAEVTRLATMPSEAIPQGPYHLLTAGVGGEDVEQESLGDYRTPEEKKRDREKYAKYKKEYLDTPKGKEWQVLDGVVGGRIHWYRIAVKHITDITNKPLTLTVQKFSGTDDFYPPGHRGRIFQLDRNGAFALAKKVADAFKRVRGTDVVVEWTAAT